MLHPTVRSTLSRAGLVWQDEEEEVIWSDYEQTAKPGDVVGLVRTHSSPGHGAGHAPRPTLLVQCWRHYCVAHTDHH